MLGGFEKVASDGWHKVESLLDSLPDAEKPLVGDRVAYTDRIKWTNEPDGKHTKGEPGLDWNKHGISIGEKGTVKKVDKEGIHVAWDLHDLYPETKGKTWSYTSRSLKALPKMKKTAAIQDELLDDDRPRAPSGDKDKKKVKSGGPTSPVTFPGGANFPR